jgi:hypothetical protein
MCLSVKANAKRRNLALHLFKAGMPRVRLVEGCELRKLYLIQVPYIKGRTPDKAHFRLVGGRYQTNVSRGGRGGLGRVFFPGVRGEKNLPQAGIACGGGGACVQTKEVWRRTQENPNPLLTTTAPECWS